MSLRNADLRLLLPSAPRTVFVSSGLETWRAGFEQAGIESVDDAPELAVVTGRDRIPPSARSVVVVGRGGRRRLRAHPGVRRFATVPDPAEPHLIVPVDRAHVARYAIGNWTTPASTGRRLRNAAAELAVSLRAFPDLDRSLTVASPPGAPFAVAAARDLGVPADADWFLTLGHGDALTRAAFQLFPPGETSPSWVLKLSRVPGYVDPFERDEHGLGLAASAGGRVAAHAPQLVGRFEAAGLPCSLETAAVGRRLTYLLQTAGPRAEKLAAIEAVAAWAVAVAQETAAPTETLAGELARLEAVVLPQWRDVPRDLVAALPPLPSVLQHNDLGCWNIVFGSGGFTAVDWESARSHGLPLWDLMYFLTDALVHLDGAWEPERRVRHAAQLLRGETESSAVLFRWVRAAVDTLAIPPDAVGAVVTLGWLHHGLSPVARDAAANAVAPGLRSENTFAEWMSKLWLRDSGLGVGWSRWRQ